MKRISHLKHSVIIEVTSRFVLGIRLFCRQKGGGTTRSGAKAASQSNETLAREPQKQIYVKAPKPTAQARSQPACVMRPTLAVLREISSNV
jgi:hypothetical protein